MPKHVLLMGSVAATALALASLFSAAPALATITDRDVLIKGPGKSAAVYYLAQDGKRYVFPNQKTFDTWFSNFTSVENVSTADLIAFPLGGNVTYRPGIKMIKITTDPKVYAVGPGGELRWVTSETVAAALYGSDWNKKIDDVPDAFFVNYHVGTPIWSASDYSPATEAQDDDTINSDKKIHEDQHTKKSDTGAQIPGYPLPSTACAWRCTDWSDCNATTMTQTRDCSQGSECMGYGAPAPDESRSCETAPPPTGGTIQPPNALNDDQTAAGIVIGGSDAVLAKFRLSALYEALQLTKATFTVATPGAVQSLTLYDGSTVIGGPVTVDGSGNAFFTNLSFLVPSNGSKDLIVRGLISAVGPSGTPTGSNAKVTMRTSSGSYVFEMRGIGNSSTVLTALPGGDLTGNDKIVRKTAPTVSLITLPSTFLVNGEVVAMRFNVAANGSADVSLKSLTVGVQKDANVGLAPTGDSEHTTIRLGGDATNLAGQSAATADCAAAAGSTCTIRTLFNDEEVIAAGTSRTYDVRLNVLGTLATSNSVSSQLLDDGVVLTGTLTADSTSDQASVAGTAVNFAWSDNSIIPHSATIGSSSADWISGRYVKVLPTDAQILVKGGSSGY